MQHERIRLGHLHQPPAGVRIEPVVELDRADVGDDRHVRSVAADLERGRELRLLPRRPHRAEPDRPAPRLGRFRQAAVDASRLVRPARHRADEQGRLELAAEPAGGEVHLLPVQLRQRLMLEAVAVEACSAGRPALHLLLEADPDMLGLARARILASGLAIRFRHRVPHPSLFGLRRRPAPAFRVPIIPAQVPQGQMALLSAST